MKRAPGRRTARRKPTRKPPRQRGYTSKWDRYTQRHRAREPLCRECLRIWDRPEPWACTDHIIPPTGPDDPLFWDPSNHQSLCLQCHGLKSWRESQGWVINWPPNDQRQVITGKPATGKSHYAQHQLPAAAIWDMDEAAKLHHFTTYPRPRYQVKVLLDDRANFVKRMQTDEAQTLAVIVTSTPTAFAIARLTRARLVHVWADETIRLARLATRSQRAQDAT